jgi:hypothetical protein
MSTKTAKSARARPRRRAPAKKTNVPNQPKQTPPSNRALPRLVVSRCASDYLAALTDPFAGPLACVPSDIINNNRISRSFIKGTFACGANVGFICLDPTHASFNDVPAVISSKSSYAGAIMDLNNVADTNLDLSNSDYAETAIGPTSPGLSYRVVAAGLRIRYRGTELDRGGTIHALVDPCHDPLLNRTVSNMDAEMQSKQLPVTKQWTTILYRPAHQGELLLSSTPPIAASKNPAITAASGFFWYMGAIITPPTNTSFSSFEYEAFVVTEYQGRNVRGQVTTHTDPIGLSAAVQATVNLRPTQASTETISRTAFTTFANVVRDGMTHMADDPAHGDIFGEVFKPKHVHDQIMDPRRQ